MAYYLWPNKLPSRIRLKVLRLHTEIFREIPDIFFQTLNPYKLFVFYQQICTKLAVLRAMPISIEIGAKVLNLVTTQHHKPDQPLLHWIYDHMMIKREHFLFGSIFQTEAKQGHPAYDVIASKWHSAICVFIFEIMQVEKIIQ